MSQNLTTRARRLQKSVTQIITTTDFNASVRITTEADTHAAKNSAFGSSGHAREVSRITHEEIEKALPSIFTAYDAERSALWWNQHSLDWVVREGVSNYFEGLTSRNTKGNKAFNRPEGEYRNLYEERRTLIMDALETKFRHPGLLPPHQRYAIAFGLFMLALGSGLGVLLTTIARKLVP